MLLAVFIFSPVWPDIHESGLHRQTVLLRWPVLVLTWSAATALGGFGSRQLKEFLTPLPYPADHNQLVTKGGYRLVRHPLYGSQLIAAFGWTVFALSLSHLLLLVTGFLFFSFKASKEEQWLTQRHPEYRDYAKRVKTFIPWIY